jgi:signal transduction histidine kinase
LEQPSSEFYDDPELNHCDKNLNIMKALEHGAPQIDIRYATTGNMAILSAIKPIISKENHILGTVIVEKSVNDIVHERNRAIEDMLNSLIIAFLFALIILLIFSSRLTRRIRSLRTEAMAATDSEGRVINTNIHGSQGRDELGDLAYELSTKLQMIGQYTNDLEEYNQYLRQYKDKLRHEMQTPTSVVQSSLELLEMEDIPPSAGKYVERAKKGVSTLGMILKSLSEAKNLEDAINNELREDFNIDQEIAEHIENYQFIYPAQTFQYKSTAKDICLHGSPHLIRIMLDKLIDNAVDFTENQQPILISLIKDTTHVCLQVKNSGQPLPQEMLSHLFNFMISMRLPENDNPHLGLGLYIVKLVAEFHGGQVKAESSTDDDGAIFSIIFPLNDTPPK